MTTVLEVLTEQAWLNVEMHRFECAQCTAAFDGGLDHDALCWRGFRLMVTWAATKEQAHIEAKVLAN